MATELDAEGRALSLPFDPEDMRYIRLRQADIARMFQVTPARVSQWVQNGTITAYADGTIDPARAAQELLKNSDPRRLRAAPFKPLNAEIKKVRAELAELAAESDQIRARTQDLQAGLRLIWRRYLEAEFWLAEFSELLAASGVDADVIEAAFDAAGDAATAADLRTLERTADPELKALVAALLIELGLATRAPPGTLAAELGDVG